MDKTEDIFRMARLFSLLTDEEIRTVAGYLSRIDTGKNHILFSEGDSGDDLYIIESGEIESHVKLANRNRRTIAHLYEGDFFGEMAMFEDAPRSATCETKSPSVLYRLNKESFFSLMKDHPSIVNRLMLSMLSEITHRLHEKSSFLTGMVTWGEAASRRAFTDELTGIYNRRHFDDSLRDAIETSRSTGVPFSLIMIDIDHFKKVNTILPDRRVDFILKEITGVLKETLSGGEILARYGGDEFTVLVPGKNRNEALKVAESLGTAVREIDYHSLTGMPDIHVTISQGIASYPDDADDMESLVRQADNALYRAKSEGRNRVACLL